MMVTNGEGREEVSHAFAQMRRAVCQRQLSFLLLLKDGRFAMGWKGIGVISGSCRAGSG